MWFLMNLQTDMLRAAMTMDAAQAQSDGSLLFEQLAELAAIRYCRPFTAANLPCGSHFTRLPPEFVPPGAAADGLAELNQHVLEMRHSCLAHTDFVGRDIYAMVSRRGDGYSCSAAG